MVQMTRVLFALMLVGMVLMAGCSQHAAEPTMGHEDVEDAPQETPDAGEEFPPTSGRPVVKDYG